MNPGDRIDLADAISSSTRGRLGLRDDVQESEWSFWERRNLNMHRIVGLWTATRSLDAGEIGEEARSALGRHFRRAWWRGLAFGVVVDVPETTLALPDLRELVDVRENTKGTWQWIVLVSGSGKEAAGVHTWIEGYLSSAYRSLLGALQGSGYEVASARREKDGLMKVLTAARRGAFPEFRNEIPGKRSA